MHYLEGYKTYLLLAGLIVFGIAHKYILKDILPGDIVVLIYGAFGAAIVAALRHGLTSEVKKIAEKIKNNHA